MPIEIQELQIYLQQAADWIGCDRPDAQAEDSEIPKVNTTRSSKLRAMEECGCIQ